MVISPNGYITKLDGNEDWIADVNWQEFLEDTKAYDNFIVGRKTYEAVMSLGLLGEDYTFDASSATHKIIITAQADFKPKLGYIVVRSPQEALDFLSKQDVKEALLAGGGELNASFAKAGLIDELELVVEPYVIGQGKPILAPGDYEFPLELMSTESLSEGRVKILYKVNKA